MSPLSGTNVCVRKKDPTERSGTDRCLLDSEKNDFLESCRSLHFLNSGGIEDIMNEVLRRRLSRLVHTRLKQHVHIIDPSRSKRL